MSSARSAAKRAFRLATLVLPAWGAWYVVFTAKNTVDLVRTVGYAIGPLWFLVTAILVLRLGALAFARKAERGTVLEQLDVLTASGSALAWSSALATIGAVYIGYASLAVVAMLGTGVFHLVLLHALVFVGGADPMRAATTITRRLVPGTVTEGDDIVEEIRFDGTRIPLGFRLFVTGSVGPRWATSRHVLEAIDSGGEVLVSAEIGPAVRGEHDVPPLEVWLEDSFGLCRTRRVPVGATRLTVLPRVKEIDEVKPLVEQGTGPRAPRRAPRLPSEGLFNLREYQPGDDVRRIHWVRSLACGEIIVRTPDEIPPDRPKVRLVLDTFFPEALVLGCEATAEILDGLVATWLSVGAALVAEGVRVTLVAAVPHGDEVATKRIELSRRDPAAGARFGASIAWQGRTPVDELLTDEETYVVARGVVTSSPRVASAHWILAVPAVTEVAWNAPSMARMPFPMGSPDNRWTRSRAWADDLARRRFEQGRAMLALRNNVQLPPAGSLAALAKDDGSIHLERIR